MTNGVLIAAKSLARSEVDVKSGLTDLTDSQVEEYMRKGAERIETKFRRGYNQVLMPGLCCRWTLAQL